MRPVDAEQKCKEYAPLLNAALFASKMREFEKLGYPSQSMGDGRGTSEPPLPMIGTTDRRLAQDRSEYGQALLHAALALETAHRIQEHWCRPLDTDTEKAKKLTDDRPGGPCPNIWCDRWITGLQNNRGRAVHGNGDLLCERCYRFTKRTGRPWTPQQEVVVAQSSSRGS